ncbi:MAG: hypothetical protein IPM33_10700 [Phycisphaerales bacterium]|nr:hypothetical protein [Phycisphaerales bacterium]
MAADAGKARQKMPVGRPAATVLHVALLHQLVPDLARAALEEAHCQARPPPLTATDLENGLKMC